MNGHGRSLLLCLTAAFALGILLGEPLVALALLPAAAHRRLRPLRVILLAFLLGALLPDSPGTPPLLTALPDGAPLVRIAGVVDSPPDSPHRGTSRLDLRVETVGDRPLPGRTRVLLTEGSPLPSPGASIEFTGRLLRPRTAGNPGESDSRARLEAENITHVARGSTDHAVRVLTRAPELSPRALLHRARLAFDRRLRSVSDPATGNLLSCLLLGRRDRIPESVERDFRRSGTVHFLAISGLHVGILAGLLWFAFHALAVPRRPAAVLVSSAILAYGALTGMRPPVARASLLVLLVALAILFRRPIRPLHLLAAAGLLILLSDPASLDSPSLLLSFSAVVSIVLLARKLMEGLFERWILLEKFTVPRAGPLHLLRRYIRTSVPVSLAAWLGTGPIVLHAFGTLSLLVIPANLLVLPLIFAILPLGLLAAATGFDAPADLIAQALTWLVSLLADIPLSSFALPPPSPVATGLHYLLLILAARRPRLGRRWAAVLVASLLATAGSGLLLRKPPDEPQLTILDVGHGLAAVLETPEGGVLIYDAGSARPRIFGRVLLPWLRHRRIGRIDTFVLSHADHDHTSGADALEDWLPVSATLPPGSVVEGNRIEVPGARVDVLWPPRGYLGSRNDASTVLRIQAGSLRILLTGDIEEDAIRRLIASGRHLEADVLIAPHHGRPEPGVGELVQAVRPRVIVASCGAREPIDPVYGDCLRTGEHGAITVRPDGVETFR